MANLKDTIVLGKLNVTDQVIADKIIKLGGTDDDILMGDGSIVSKQELIESLESAMAGVNDGTLTLKASGGVTATQKTFTANDSNNVTFEVKHAVPSGADEGSYGPSEGGEQEAKGTLDITVPQITTDEFGHVTGVSNKTFTVTDTDTNTWQANTKDQDGYVTKGEGQANKVWKTNADGVPGWRSDSNTDTKVKQSNTTTANWRKVILSNQSDATMGTATTEKTDVVYVTPKIEAQPSTGSLRMAGNMLLHNPNGGDSPKLIFQRGDEKGTVTDWNMYVQSGALKINSVPTSNSTTERNIAEFAYNGGMTIYSCGDTDNTETASMTVKTSNGGQLIIGKEGPNSGTMLRFDQVAGTTRLRFRSSSTQGAMVWEQPEQAARLYLDFGNAAGNGKNRVNVPNPEGGGTLATQEWVEGKGYLTSHQSLSGYVTGSNLTADYFVLGNGGSSIKKGNYRITTDINSNSTNAYIPTAEAVDTFVSGKLSGISTSDQKTSSSNQLSTKLYIVGAQSASTSGVTTYTNSGCYIGTDNCLYSNGKKVATEEWVEEAVNDTIDSIRIYSQAQLFNTNGTPTGNWVDGYYNVGAQVGGSSPQGNTSTSYTNQTVTTSGATMNLRAPYSKYTARERWVLEVNGKGLHGIALSGAGYIPLGLNSFVIIFNSASDGRILTITKGDATFTVNVNFQTNSFID